MLNVEKYDLPANVISEINAQVLTMLATGTAYQFDENTYEDFASSIHNLVDLSIQLGKEGVAVRSELLRDELAKRGIRAPTDDFIYFGGRCISTPTMFIPKSSRKEVAEKWQMISSAKCLRRKSLATTPWWTLSFPLQPLTTFCFPCVLRLWLVK